MEDTPGEFDLSYLLPFLGASFLPGVGGLLSSTLSPMLVDKLTSDLGASPMFSRMLSMMSPLVVPKMMGHNPSPMGIYFGQGLYDIARKYLHPDMDPSLLSKAISPEELDAFKSLPYDEKMKALEKLGQQMYVIDERTGTDALDAAGKRRSFLDYLQKEEPAQGEWLRVRFKDNPDIFSLQRRTKGKRGIYKGLLEGDIDLKNYIEGAGDSTRSVNLGDAMNRFWRSTLTGAGMIPRLQQPSYNPQGLAQMLGSMNLQNIGPMLLSELGSKMDAASGMLEPYWMRAKNWAMSPFLTNFFSGDANNYF